MNAYKEEIDIKIESLEREVKASQDIIDRCNKDLSLLAWINFRVSQRDDVSPLDSVDINAAYSPLDGSITSITTGPPDDEPEEEVTQTRIGEAIKLGDIQCGEWVRVNEKMNMHKATSLPVVRQFAGSEYIQDMRLDELNVELYMLVIEDPTKDKEETTPRPMPQVGDTCKINEVPAMQCFTYGGDSYHVDESNQFWLFEIATLCEISKPLWSKYRSLSPDLEVTIIEDPMKPKESRVGGIYHFDELKNGDCMMIDGLIMVYGEGKDGSQWFHSYSPEAKDKPGLAVICSNFRNSRFHIIAKPEWVKE